MKKKLLFNALILTGSALLLRSVGISFRVYISNRIGAEGMGLYQLISSVFMLASTLATSGISIAVTRLVSESAGKVTGKNRIAILRKSFAYSLAFSITASFLLFASARYIGTVWLHDDRTVTALQILAPSLPFIGLSSCLRGYFIAVRKVAKSAGAQIFDQFIRIFITVNLLGIFVPKGLEYACSALVIGTAAAEMVSCAYMFLLYYLDKRKDSIIDNGSIGQKGVLNRLLGISLPIAASSYVRSALMMLENILIQKIKVNYIIIRVLQLTLLLSILVMGVFVSFSYELGLAIYHSREVGELLLVLAPLIPLMYLDRIVDGILKGLNQQVSSLKYDLLGSMTRIGLIYYLIPLKGVTGFIIIIYASSILNSFLSINRLFRVTDLRFKFLDWLFLPVLSVISSGLISSLLLRIINSGNLPLGVGVAVGIAVTIVLYFCFLLLLESIKKEDLVWLKNCFRNSGRIPKPSELFAHLFVL